MTLKVGEIYQGMYEGNPESLLIERIDLFNAPRCKIHFRVLLWKTVPRILYLFCDSEIWAGHTFVAAIDAATEYIRDRTPLRSVDEVEVKYR